MAKEFVSEQDYLQNLKHAREVDTDMSSLRSDPRWADFLKKYTPAGKDEPERKKEEDGGGMGDGK